MIGKVFLRKIKKALIEQKEDIISKASQVNKDEIVDTDGDDTDEIQAKILIETTKQLHIRTTQRLKEIDKALYRIEHKGYGLCLDCGEGIPEKRLTFNPCIQTCVDCAEDREKELNKGRR